MSSIDLKFYLCHKRLLSVSYVMIMAERVRKDLEPFVEHISDKKEKFRYAEVKIER